MLSESRLRELVRGRRVIWSLYEVRAMAEELLRLRSAMRLFLEWHEMDHEAMEAREIQKRYDEAINAAKAAETLMEEGK